MKYDFTITAVINCAYTLMMYMYSDDGSYYKSSFVPCGNNFFDTDFISAPSLLQIPVGWVANETDEKGAVWKFKNKDEEEKVVVNQGTTTQTVDKEELFGTSGDERRVCAIYCLIKRKAISINLDDVTSINHTEEDQIIPTSQQRSIDLSDIKKEMITGEGTRIYSITISFKATETDDGYQEFYLTTGNNVTSGGADKDMSNDNPVICTDGKLLYSKKDISTNGEGKGSATHSFTWLRIWSYNNIKDWEKIYLTFSAHGTQNDEWKASEVVVTITLGG